MNAIGFKNLFYLKQLPVVSIIIANIIPLAGVIFFQWSYFNIFFLYWLETIIIGFYGFIKTRMAKGKENVSNNPAPYLKDLKEKNFFRLILAYLAGILIFGIFIFENFCNCITSSGNYVIAGLNFFPTAFTVSFVGLFISHGIDFFSNFIKKEFLNMTAGAQLRLLAVRLLVIVIIVISFNTLKFFSIITHSEVGFSMQFVLFVLIIFKIISDLTIHFKEN